MKIKVIACDVYNTILMSNDADNCVPARKGFTDFAKIILEKGIKLVTSSDNGTDLVKIDLKESGVSPDIFDAHFKMESGQPKDYRPILTYFCIKPEELMVFGDNFDIDIWPAMRPGCRARLVPAYTSLSDNFDWATLLRAVI